MNNTQVETLSKQEVNVAILNLLRELGIIDKNNFIVDKSIAIEISEAFCTRTGSPDQTRTASGMVEVIHSTGYGSSGTEGFIRLKGEKFGFVFSRIKTIKLI